MKIAPNCFVEIEFTLTGDDGTVLDSSDGESFTYLQGHDEVVPGLEKGLAGKEAGNALRIVVVPEDGFGERDPQRVTSVPRSEWPADLEVEVGDEVAADDSEGEAVTMWVTAIDANEVNLDGNHPLAGMTLIFEVKILAVRQATAAELEEAHAEA